MKKIVLIFSIGFISFVIPSNSNLAMAANGYIMVPEICSSDPEKTHNVCRPAEDFSCSISDQTLC
jgi:hypothetical protein